MPLKTKSAPKGGADDLAENEKVPGVLCYVHPAFSLPNPGSPTCRCSASVRLYRLHPFKPASFVGLQNFQKLFSQAGFWKAFFNTLQISVTKLVIDTLGSIVLALLLDELHFKWFKRSPRPSSPSRTYVLGCCGFHLYHVSLRRKNGLINGVITALGGDSIYFSPTKNGGGPSFI